MIRVYITYYLVDKEKKLSAGREGFTQKCKNLMLIRERTVL